jgi:hypothetical protein
VSLSIGRNKLHNAFDALHEHWHECQTQWADVVRQDFEKNYWEPIEPDVSAVLRAMDRLSLALSQLRHDCG